MIILVTLLRYLVNMIKKKGTKVGFGHFQKISDEFNAGLEVSLDPHEVTNSVLKVAGNYKIDKDSSVRPRLTVFSKTKEIRLGFIYKQTLSSFAKLTFSSDLCGNLLFDKKESDDFRNHQLGVAVTFFDD